MAVAEVSEWPDELLRRGIVIETDSGVMAFSHALVRDAFYSELPWTRRVSLHRAVAERLEAQGAAPVLIAEHWVLGRRPEQARKALLVAAVASGAVHAYRDAERATRRALELWPEAHQESGRLDVLERLAGYAELAGDVAEAIPTWREVADGRRQEGDLARLGTAHHRLAAALELQGRWQEALASRGLHGGWPTGRGCRGASCLGSASPVRRKLPRGTQPARDRR
jgi:tetratricopeptide (TPR) repeat protein